MKKLLNVPQNAAVTDLALLFLRIGIASMMLVHGVPKLMMLLSGDPVQFPAVLGLSPQLSLALTVFAEVVCSLFILLGLGTRFATMPLLIVMLVAILLVHAADPFSVKELAFHYLLGYTVLLVAGSGRYSVDYLWQARRNHATAVALQARPVLH